MTSDFFDLMVQAAIGTSAAMLLVLVLRRRAHAAFGARTAYALWLIVPIAMIASLLPADFVVTDSAPKAERRAPVVEVPALTDNDAPAPLTETRPKTGTTAQKALTRTNAAAPTVPDGWLMVLWLAGTCASLGALAYGQRRFMRRHGLRARTNTLRVSRHADVGPAVLGFMTPRIVVPTDFRDAYNRLERRLILAHEQAHIRAGDMQTNALAIAIRSLNWFNPLAYIAYGLFRADQEMACDERVMRRFGQHRRLYAETLLKSQLMGERAPLGCSWFGDTRHPLKDRVAKLARRELSPARRMLGVTLLLGATSLSGMAAWATLATQVIYIEGDNTAGRLAQADSFISPDMDTGGDSTAQQDPLKAAQGAALVDAIMERRRDHARAFLKAGVDVNYHRKGDGTPLSVAVLVRDREMVDMLIKAGADVNKPALGDGTPLLVAARNRDAAMVATLLEAGADVNGYSPGDGTALIAAARSGDKAVVEQLLKAGAKVNQVAPGDGTALLAAIERDDPAIMEMLMAAGADLNMVAPGDGTALTMAAQMSHDRVLDRLIKLGADVNKAAPGDGTPLLVAARNGDTAIVKKLLAAGADIDGYSPGDGTALIAAVQASDQAMIELLLEAGADVNKAAPGDGNALIMAAAVGDLAIVKRLMDAGADVNGFVLGDETPLITASRAGHLEVVEYLISKGANVNARVPAGQDWQRRSERYRSPLGQALRYEHNDIADYLREKGATEPKEPEDR
ncbi:M56 family metallopeptidase [Kordiimonas aestuarii]|uniref:M56 family metallopeptidase n=1 Tax=Kordiimonas aestuarii TaxID=1005925 RepID=UPI0021D2EEED|nr:M56 family metallopeptidase [Kordiimonas aestuarii]